MITDKEILTVVIAGFAVISYVVGLYMGYIAGIKDTSKRVKWDWLEEQARRRYDD